MSYGFWFLSKCNANINIYLLNICITLIDQTLRIEFSKTVRQSNFIFRISENVKHHHSLSHDASRRWPSWLSTASCLLLFSAIPRYEDPLLLYDLFHPFAQTCQVVSRKILRIDFITKLRSFLNIISNSIQSLNTLSALGIYV